MKPTVTKNIYTTLEPDPAWKKRATSFVIRSHRQLWGKNNEEPLAWLFLQGLKNSFVKEIYMGWNKHGQERSWESWGLAPGQWIGQDEMEQETEQRKGQSHNKRLILPSGLVIPFIRNKKLLKITLLRYEQTEKLLIIPGSLKVAMILKNDSSCVDIVPWIMDALFLHQEREQGTSVLVPHPGDTPLDQEAQNILNNAQNIRLFIQQTDLETSKTAWIEKFPEIKIKEYSDRRELVNLAAV